MRPKIMNEDKLQQTLLVHELLDRTSTIMEMMDHLIRQHPYLQKNGLEPYFDDAYDSLAKLYQRIGSLDIDTSN